MGLARGSLARSGRKRAGAMAVTPQRVISFLDILRRAIEKMGHAREGIC